MTTFEASDDTPRPDTRSPGRFLAWLVRGQLGLLALIGLLAVVFLLPAAVAPWALGRALDEGIIGGDNRALGIWVGLLAVTTFLGAATGGLHHLLSVRSWLAASYGTIDLVTNRTLSLGHIQGRRTPTGEALSVAGSDATQFGAFVEVAGRAIGSVAAYGLVAVIVLNTNPRLGAVVLLVAPILAFISGPLLRPLQKAQTQERSRNSELTSMATDIVAGLRVLRGIGGEDRFAAGYDAQSARVREAGVRSGVWSGAIDAAGVLLSGVFVVGLMILGVQEVRRGSLTVGELVTFLGYALFLLQPIRTFFEFAQKLILSLVSAEKTVNLLGHDSPWPARPPRTLDVDGLLKDDASGAGFSSGRITMVVSAVPEESAALADRLGRYLPDEQPIALDPEEELSGRAARSARNANARARRRRSEHDADLAQGAWGVRLSGVDLSEVPLGEVRRVIHVQDARPAVFAGTLREAVDPHGQLTREDAEEVLAAAAAHDVYESVPGGWQGQLEERGRGLSGGQRQRLMLARSYAIDAPVLVLVEPTSAVDAHTEEQIARRLRRIRPGRTTIIATTSPLLLHHADEVVLLRDGAMVTRGTHAHLLEHHEEYRRVVSRTDQPAHAHGGEHAKR